MADLELIPEPGDGEREAVSRAVVETALDLESRDDAYGSAWRAAGLTEGVDRSGDELPGLGPEPSTA